MVLLTNLSTITCVCVCVCVCAHTYIHILLVVFLLGCLFCAQTGHLARSCEDSGPSLTLRPTVERVLAQKYKGPYTQQYDNILIYVCMHGHVIVR